MPGIDEIEKHLAEHKEFYAGNKLFTPEALLAKNISLPELEALIKKIQATIEPLTPLNYKELLQKNPLYHLLNLLLDYAGEKFIAEYQHKPIADVFNSIRSYIPEEKIGFIEDGVFPSNPDMKGYALNFL